MSADVTALRGENARLKEGHQTYIATLQAQFSEEKANLTASNSTKLADLTSDYERMISELA